MPSEMPSTTALVAVRGRGEDPNDDSAEVSSPLTTLTPQVLGLSAVETTAPSKKQRHSAQPAGKNNGWLSALLGRPATAADVGAVSSAESPSAALERCFSTLAPDSAPQRDGADTAAFLGFCKEALERVVAHLLAGPTEGPSPIKGSSFVMTGVKASTGAHAHSSRGVGAAQTPVLPLRPLSSFVGAQQSTPAAIWRAHSVLLARERAGRDADPRRGRAHNASGTALCERALKKHVTASVASPAGVTSPAAAHPSWVRRVRDGLPAETPRTDGQPSRSASPANMIEFLLPGIVAVEDLGANASGTLPPAAVVIPPLHGSAAATNLEPSEFASPADGELPAEADADDAASEATADHADDAASERHRRATRVTTGARLAEDFDDGTSELNQYVLLDVLGRGAQGEVHLAMDTEKNELRAIKAVARPGGLGGGGGGAAGGSATVGPLNAARRRQREQLEREVAIMKRCRHRNVVALYEVIDDPAHERLYLVMQYVDHGPLARTRRDGSVTATVPGGQLARFARQLCAGLEYLHRRGIVHRDIKPENILLGQDEQVYLADFGVAEISGAAAAAADDDCSDAPLAANTVGAMRTRISGTRGTLPFLAPELLSAPPTAIAASPVAFPDTQDQSHFVDGEAVDVWALGVTLYALLYGTLPFYDANDAVALFDAICETEPRFPTPASLPSSSPDAAAPSTVAHPPSPTADGLPPPLHLLRRSSAYTDDADDDALFDSASPRSARRRSQASGASATTDTALLWRRVLAGMLVKDPSKRWRLPRVRRELAAITRLTEAADQVTPTIRDAIVARRYWPDA